MHYPYNSQGSPNQVCSCLSHCVLPWLLFCIWHAKLCQFTSVRLANERWEQRERRGSVGQISSLCLPVRRSLNSWPWNVGAFCGFAKQTEAAFSLWGAVSLAGDKASLQTKITWSASPEVAAAAVDFACQSTLPVASLKKTFPDPFFLLIKLFPLYRLGWCLAIVLPDTHSFTFVLVISRRGFGCMLNVVSASSDKCCFSRIHQKLFKIPLGSHFCEVPRAPYRHFWLENNIIESSARPQRIGLLSGHFTVSASVCLRHPTPRTEKRFSLCVLWMQIAAMHHFTSRFR